MCVGDQVTLATSDKWDGKSAFDEKVSRATITCTSTCCSSTVRLLRTTTATATTTGSTTKSPSGRDGSSSHFSEEWIYKNG